MITREYVLDGQVRRWAAMSSALTPASQGGGGGGGDPFDPFAPLGGDAFGNAASLPETLVSQFLPWARKVDKPGFIQAWFESEMGVTFPEGSWIRYQESGSILAMHNTAENQSLLQSALIKRELLSFQVNIRFRLLAFPVEQIDSLDRKYPAGIPGKEIITMWQEGEGKTLGRQGVSTINGVNAIVECVTEVIYPTQMVTAASDGDETPVYGGHETRNVGFILNVTPMVQLNPNLINLTMIPEHAEKLQDKQEELPAELRPMVPLFDSLNLTTSTIQRNGKPQVIAHSTSRDGQQVYYLVVSATLNDIEGSPLGITPPLSAPKEEKQP